MNRNGEREGKEGQRHCALSLIYTTTTNKQFYYFFKTFTVGV